MERDVGTRNEESLCSEKALPTMLRQWQLKVITVRAGVALVLLLLLLAPPEFGLLFVRLHIDLAPFHLLRPRLIRAVSSR